MTEVLHLKGEFEIKKEFHWIRDVSFDKEF